MQNQGVHTMGAAELVVAQGAVITALIAAKAVELKFRQPPASIGDLLLDASVKESHHVRAKATRHPVENAEGEPATVSDHVLLEPLSLQIDGIITNTPVMFLAGVFSASSDPVHDAYMELETNVLTGRIVTVTTSLRVYENMVLESVEITRDVSKANALHFSATATQITLVNTEDWSSSTTRPAPRATRAAGKVPAKPSGATVKGKSMLIKASDAVVKGLRSLVGL
jgi:hypothetical protein